MGKIIHIAAVSLDGFFEGPDREIDWHLVDDELHQHFNDKLSRMGAFLAGRRTHALMAEFWPTADRDPAISGPMAEFARIWREMPKIVYSRTWESTDWNTTILREVVADEVLALKASTGGDLSLGSADLASTFRRLGLIDEHHLYVNPVLLGRGRPLFGPADDRTDLDLIDSRTFGNGVVLLRYRVGS
ncbi:dihydrofolate reductase family protein [Saccharothrix deserti]|uniref:dihydrofolate reductase family protein n=1 Tax=Saccharothrix deserti TaxID=2593674 RepID=UPI00131D9A3B|nr:dihydrofolate reductase family protein [Saccharothrix deserti]